MWDEVFFYDDFCIFFDGVEIFGVGFLGEEDCVVGVEGFGVVYWFVVDDNFGFVSVIF